MDDVDVLAPEELLCVLVAGDAESFGERFELRHVRTCHGHEIGAVVISKRPREPVRGVPVPQPEDRHSPFMHS